MSDPQPEDVRPHLSVAAPCFNEAEGIAQVITEWNRILAEFPYKTEIVICNDGSTDTTAEILKDLQGRYPRLRVVELETNGGYGRALSKAVNATRGDFVATIDSDGQFDLSDLKHLLLVAEEGSCQLVTGYRLKKHDTPTRVLANKLLNLLVRWLFRIDLRDTNCALKVARAEVLRGLSIEATGWATPTEICLRVHAQGQQIRELGVNHRDRVHGTSKMHPLRVAWRFFRYLMYMRLKLHLYRAGILNSP